MKDSKLKSKGFNDLGVAEEYAKRVNGTVKKTVNSKYSYKVTYNYIKPIQEHLTITFKSYKRVLGFKLRLEKEGKEQGVNQDLTIKEKNGLYKIRFKLTKKKVNKDYVDDWCISNLNGDFAYNGVTEDF